jgi:hypothetical protein
MPSLRQFAGLKVSRRCVEEIQGQVDQQILVENKGRYGYRRQYVWIECLPATGNESILYPASCNWIVFLFLLLKPVDDI